MCIAWAVAALVKRTAGLPEKFLKLLKEIARNEIEYGHFISDRVTLNL